MKRILLAVAMITASCESLEGDRVSVPSAPVSILIPSNWAYQIATAANDGEAVLSAASQQEKSVHLKVFVLHRPALLLEDLVQQTLADVAAMEKAGEVKVTDVLQISLTRQHLRGFRTVHQLTLAAAHGEAAPIQITQIADHLWRSGVGVTLLVVGAKDAVETLSAELDRMLGSVKSLEADAADARPTPPDAVSSASVRAAQQLFMHAPDLSR